MLEVRMDTTDKELLKEYEEFDQLRRDVTPTLPINKRGDSIWEFTPERIDVTSFFDRLEKAGYDIETHGWCGMPLPYAPTVEYLGEGDALFVTTTQLKGMRTKGGDNVIPNYLIDVDYSTWGNHWFAQRLYDISVVVTESEVINLTSEEGWDRLSQLINQ